MKKVLVALVLLLFTISRLAPLLVVGSDKMAHWLSNAEHLRTLHHLHGHDHLHQELNHIHQENDNKGNNGALFSSSWEISCHQLHNLFLFKDALYAGEFLYLSFNEVKIPLGIKARIFLPPKTDL